MERVLQLLDEIEDTLFCLPLVWGRVRGRVCACLGVLAVLAVAVALFRWLPVLPAPGAGLLVLGVPGLWALTRVARGRLPPLPRRQHGT